MNVSPTTQGVTVIMEKARQTQCTIYISKITRKKVFYIYIKKKYFYGKNGSNLKSRKSLIKNFVQSVPLNNAEKRTTLKVDCEKSKILKQCTRGEH